MTTDLLRWIKLMRFCIATVEWHVSDGLVAYERIDQESMLRPTRSHELLRSCLFRLQVSMRDSVVTAAQFVVEMSSSSRVGTKDLLRASA